MSGSRGLACAVFLAAVAASGAAVGQESYDGLIIGPMASEGRRWGWGAEPGATVGGFGGFAGARLERWRLGLFEQNIWWVGSHGIVLDFGGFVSIDWASIWIDPQLSAAMFFRIEPAIRFKRNESVWALAPSGVVGGRLAGVEIGFLATPEILALGASERQQQTRR